MFIELYFKIILKNNWKQFSKNIIFLFLKIKKRNYSKKIVIKQVLSFFLFWGMIFVYSIDDIIKLKIESNFLKFLLK